VNPMTYYASLEQRADRLRHATAARRAGDLAATPSLVSRAARSLALRARHRASGSPVITVAR
jgi:hypothetical protein